MAGGQPPRQPLDDTWDTATAVCALAQYSARLKEAQASYHAVLTVNGKPARAWDVTPANALAASGPITVDAALLQPGANRIELKREGAGSLYYNALLTWYTADDPIKGMANRLAATRRYLRVIPVPDAKEDQPSEKLEPLAAGQVLKPGEVIEAEVTLHADNAFSYVCVVDPKPAGFEPLEQLSAEHSAEGAWVHQELRERQVIHYVDRLRQGQTVIRYRLRALTPGTFHALPAEVRASYRPEARGLSDEGRLEVSSK